MQPQERSGCRPTHLCSGVQAACEQVSKFLLTFSASRILQLRARLCACMMTPLVCKQASCARHRSGLLNETRQGSELAGEDWRADDTSAWGGLPHDRVAATRESYGHRSDAGMPPPPELVPSP